MFFDQISFTPVQKLTSKLLKEANVELWVKRDDQIHKAVSGNKWRKLKYNIKAAQQLKASGLITFGGAFSNHIYAVAAAAQIVGLPSVGIIRGEHTDPLNPTLSFAKSCGMHLQFVSRSAYRNKTILKNEYSKLYPNFYFIPEGGTNILALRGCEELIEEIRDQFEEMPDYICTSCGTGGTLTGLIKGMNGRQQLIGFSALKGDFLKMRIKELLEEVGMSHLSNWNVNTEFHFGGYARHDQVLIDFINAFKGRHKISLDPVYTGKLFYGLFEMIKRGDFPRGSRILVIHTGGLQGVLGFNHRFGKSLD